jgi:predicted nucleic acid-binding protein
VKQEIEAAFSDCSKWRQCLKDRFFIVRHVKNPLLLRQLLLHLHSGEAEALCICMENKAQLCLLDDKDARIAAGLNRIPVTGTLGILIQAKKRGLTDSVRYFMDELKDRHHFWISNAMYKKVLELSGEK